jgi:hypothetical protein
LVGTLTLTCATPGERTAVERTSGVIVSDGIEDGEVVAETVVVDVAVHIGDGVSTVEVVVTASVGVGDSTPVTGISGLEVGASAVRV